MRRDRFKSVTVIKRIAFRKSEFCALSAACSSSFQHRLNLGRGGNVALSGRTVA